MILKTKDRNKMLKMKKINKTKKKKINKKYLPML